MGTSSEHTLFQPIFFNNLLIERPSDSRKSKSTFLLVVIAFPANKSTCGGVGIAVGVEEEEVEGVLGEGGLAGRCTERLIVVTKTPMVNARRLGAIKINGVENQRYLED